MEVFQLTHEIIEFDAPADIQPKIREWCNANGTILRAVFQPGTGRAGFFRITFAFPEDSRAFAKEFLW